MKLPISSVDRKLPITTTHEDNKKIADGVFPNIKTYLIHQKKWTGNQAYSVIMV